MITHFYIDNFKSLTDFSFSCCSLTCLVGLNNSGKSTVLQAIDFLSSVASGNITQWLKSRGWKISEIKSHRFKRKQRLSFRVCFVLQNKKYSWSGTLNLTSLGCSSEQITRFGKEDELLLEVDQGSYRLLQGSKKAVDFAYEGSILALLKEQLLNLELTHIRHFLCSVKSLGLLNPTLLKKRARESAEDMGAGGEKIAAFLYRLPEEKKEQINKNMRHVFRQFGSFNVKAGSSGWKELRIYENYNNAVSETLTEARHASDGFLRILALFSQLQTDHSVLLFDEIEDGLNHEIMEYLTDEMVRSPQQIICTTHSPMILNFLEDETARESVVLIYRDSDTGKTCACNFFDISRVKDKLEYMGPGEVFANVSLKDLP